MFFYPHTFSVQTSLVALTILKWGTEEQKQLYLPKLCSGEFLGCYGLTEPDAGSDAGNQQTRAVKDGNDYLLTRLKRVWISAAPSPLRSGICHCRSCSQAQRHLLLHRQTPNPKVSKRWQSTANSV